MLILISCLSSTIFLKAWINPTIAFSSLAWKTKCHHKWPDKLQDRTNAVHGGKLVTQQAEHFLNSAILQHWLESHFCYEVGGAWYSEKADVATFSHIEYERVQYGGEDKDHVHILWIQSSRNSLREFSAMQSLRQVCKEDCDTHCTCRPMRYVFKALRAVLYSFPCSEDLE